MITIVDNFLPEEEFLKLKSDILSPEFYWKHNKGKVYADDGESQLIHGMYMDDRWSSDRDKEIIDPLLSRINPSYLYKIKINRTLPKEEIKQTEMHTDVDNMITAVYYVNTNNGKTIFEEGIESASVENRLVVFGSNLRHNGTSSTDNERIVININFKAN
jgi:hypothetical protein